MYIEKYSRLNALVRFVFYDLGENLYQLGEISKYYYIKFANKYSNLLKNKIMKKLLSTLFILTIIFCGCEKGSDLTISGSQSALGEEGVIISSSSVTTAGISGFSATVTSLSDGVSSINAQVNITNATIKQILANVPGVTISGNSVSASGVEVKFTDKGIENKFPFFQGVLVKYDSNVGDTYPVKDSETVRKVIQKSTTDDFPYGFYNIKVVGVQHDINFNGLKTVKYWTNHKFGVVKVQCTLVNGDIIDMPIYSSVTN